MLPTSRTCFHAIQVSEPKIPFWHTKHSGLVLRYAANRDAKGYVRISTEFKVQRSSVLNNNFLSKVNREKWGCEIEVGTSRKNSELFVLLQSPEPEGQRLTGMLL